MKTTEVLFQGLQITFIRHLVRVLAIYHTDSFSSWWLMQNSPLLWKTKCSAPVVSQGTVIADFSRACQFPGRAPQLGGPLLKEGGLSPRFPQVGISQPATSLVTQLAGSWKQSSSHTQQIIKDYNYATSRRVISVPWQNCKMSSQSFTFILWCKMHFSSTCSSCTSEFIQNAQGTTICCLELNNLRLSRVYTDLFSRLLQMKWAVWIQTSVKGSVELRWVVPTLPTLNLW